MNEDEDRAARSKAAQDILDELREVKETLARLEALMEKIALGLGVAP